MGDYVHRKAFRWTSVTCVAGDTHSIGGPNLFFFAFPVLFLFIHVLASGINQMWILNNPKDLLDNVMAHLMSKITFIAHFIRLSHTASPQMIRLTQVWNVKER